MGNFDLDVDAPLVGAFDTGASAPEGNEGASAETVAAGVVDSVAEPVQAVADEAKAQADAAKVAEEAKAVEAAKAAEDAVKAEAEAKAKAEAKEIRETDRVIELSRSKREAEREAAKARKEADGHAANVKKLEPVTQLFKLAESDPLAFISEIADVAGLSAERVLQIIQSKGAGGEVAPLTSDEKMALLERQIAELKAPKPEAKPTKDPKAEARAEEARSNFINTFEAILDAAPGQYPHSSKDADAPQAAFLILANHWTANGRQADGSTRPDYRPPTLAQALTAVERTLSKRNAPAAPSTPPAQTQPSNPPSGGNQPARAPSSGVGLSNSMAILPDESDRILSDDEIRADLMRRFSP